MRNSFKVLAIGILMFGMVSGVCAQEALYKNGIGGIVGNHLGVSFKTFFSSKLAMQIDLGPKFTHRCYTIEVNPNLVYQGMIHDWTPCRLDWFAGGGLSIGYAWAAYYGSRYGGYYGYAYGYGGSGVGKFGINAIGGVELKFHKVPIAISTDFRPGYGGVFGRGSYGSVFDWGYTTSIRYIFGK